MWRETIGGVLGSLLVGGRRRWHTKDRHESAEDAFRDAMHALWR